MPSPFPGMDPYLENAALWPDVHHELISEIRARLGSQLRPKYVVLVEERVYISDETDPGQRVIIPDVRVATGPATRGQVAADKGRGGMQVAEAIEVTELIDDEIHEPLLHVIDAADHQIVAVIEVLSPTNKVRGARGRKQYLKKRKEVRSSSSHLVEIDLLRAGAPVFTGHPLPPHDYMAYVSRAVGSARRGWVWPIRLEQRLPVVAVPLRGADADATLPLQDVLSAAYDRAGYDLVVDYSREPVPPLRPEQAKWAARLLSKIKKPAR